VTGLLPLPASTTSRTRSPGSAAIVEPIQASSRVRSVAHRSGRSLAAVRRCARASSSAAGVASWATTSVRSRG
jgi:hypothetical protein